MTQAFILGAGLGTRLRPLTDHLPKPLVPLFHRPLVSWTLDACARVGIQSFAINTHHLPQTWHEFVAQPQNHELDISLFHEPVLLETGGGLKNIAAWADNKPILVHNGDIYSTIDLQKLITAHEASGLPVTLALRSEGTEKRVALDDSLTRVIDMRHALGRAAGTHVFSGIYCVNPDFFGYLPEDTAISVIPAFLDLINEDKLGAIVLEDGLWLDLGNRESYLSAHRKLALGPAIHPLARIHAGATIENSVVGSDAVICSGAAIRDSVVWPGAFVSNDAVLEHCVVYTKKSISGYHRHSNL